MLMRLREQKVQVFRSIHPMTPDEVARRTVRGQYGPGNIDDHAVLGYREEPGVDPNSSTETFGAIEFRNAGTAIPHGPNRMIILPGCLAAIHLRTTDCVVKNPAAQFFADQVKCCLGAFTPGSIVRKFLRRQLCPRLFDSNKALLNDPAKLNPLLENIPLKRLGKPEDLSGVAAFLASPDADYITGTTIFVDGGLLWSYEEQ
jgi:hypothetical protein